MTTRRTLLPFVLVLACHPADAPTQATAPTPTPPVVAKAEPAPEQPPAGVVVPRTGFDAAAAESTRNSLEQLVQLAEMFRVQRRACPTDVAQLKEGGFSSRVILDGWDRPPLILCTGPGDVVVVSAGPDGAFGSADDIRSSDVPRL